MRSLLTIASLTLLSIISAQTRATPPKYPQPPLPATSAVNDPSAWTLDPTFEITDVPQTREYFWDMKPVAAAPDGYPRQIYAVNNMFPGPLIEANQGDTIIVHLTNNLPAGQSIHWHGIYQNGSQWMDGVPGVSQCPISPGTTFTYEFKVDHQYGSYWWHSHWANTMADGLVGGLIVHSVNDPIKRGRDFDVETVVFVQDWMDLQSTDIVSGLHTSEGYRGNPAPPQGNSILINGLGQTNCSNEDIQDHDLPCVLAPPNEIRVPANKRVKMRFMNVGSYAMLRMSVDGHPFDIVEIDDTPIWGPTGVHEAQVGPGQRLSVIVNTTNGKAGDAWYMRASIVTECIGASGLVQEGLAVLRYVDDEGNSPSTAAPDTKAWNDLQGTAAKCQDLDEEYSMSPRDPKDAPTTVLQTHVMSSSLGNFIGADGHKLGNFGFNNVTFQAQIGNPLLAQLQAGESLDGKLIAHATYDNIGGGDLIVNNLDANIAHPYHFHGKPFFIVARGKGNLTVAQWEAKRHEAKTANPLRRDVLQIPGGSYAVLRLVTDLPGVWPLHCHIGWHLSEGKLAAIVVQPEAIRAMTLPQDWKDLCKAYDHDDFGPARRQTEPPLSEHPALGERQPAYIEVKSRLRRSGPVDR